MSDLPPEAIETPEPPENHKSYLGDGAYVDTGSYASEVVLTTEDGINVQNRVVLGPMEIKLLDRWLRERQLLP